MRRHALLTTLDALLANGRAPCALRVSRPWDLVSLSLRGKASASRGGACSSRWPEVMAPRRPCFTATAYLSFAKRWHKVSALWSWPLLHVVPKISSLEAASAACMRRPQNARLDRDHEGPIMSKDSVVGYTTQPMTHTTVQSPVPCTVDVRSATERALLSMDTKGAVRVRVCRVCVSVCGPRLVCVLCVYCVCVCVCVCVHDS